MILQTKHSLFFFSSHLLCVFERKHIYKHRFSVQPRDRKWSKMANIAEFPKTALPLSTTACVWQLLYRLLFIAVVSCEALYEEMGGKKKTIKLNKEKLIM